MLDTYGLEYIELKIQRQEILHLLCDAISYYKISNCVTWARIVDIKKKLEDDLKEYVEEFMENAGM